MTTVPERCRGTESADLVRFLLCPGTYQDMTERVELVETHISWVFLTARHVYKLKKPVRFDFLDFSAPSLRRQACENEVRLNRRLASGVYLGVIPVTRQGTQFRLHGRGEPVDWLVKMRRLPQERSVDVLIRDQSLTEKDIAAIATALIDFYRRLPPEPIQTEAYLRNWERHVQGNRDELLRPDHRLDADLVRRIHASQLRLLRLMPEAFRNRALDGRIVEGHGDLRPEHIYLVGEVAQIIDCIEFNRDFRVLDVVDELSFLAVECTYRGAKGVGGRILDAYCLASEDLPPPPLLSFYMCYRACVRAKVHALRASQVDEREEVKVLQQAVGRYLQLASEYATAIGPPLLLTVRGLMGTGKSTLATALQQLLDMELLQTDAIRRELFGASAQPADYDEGHYHAQKRQAVYDEMLARAEARLARGQSVILDGTFLTRPLRARVASLARRQQAIPLFIHCQCPDDVARERMALRMARGPTLSEARPDLLEQQRREEEADPVGVLACTIDTTGSLPDMTAAVLGRLKSILA